MLQLDKYILQHIALVLIMGGCATEGPAPGNISDFCLICSHKEEIVSVFFQTIKALIFSEFISKEGKRVDNLFSIFWGMVAGGQIYLA